MFVAYKGFRIVELAGDGTFEVRDRGGRVRGRYMSMSAAVQAVHRLLSGDR